MLTLPTSAKIIDIQQENYRTKTFTFDLTLAATPGQFVMVWLPRFDEKPFSLVNANPVTLMITAVGPFSRLLHEKQPGDKVWFRGPFGQGYTVPPAHQRVALVGGGWGWHGGHNPLEPVRWGVPTLIGEGYSNFQDLVEPLKTTGQVQVVAGENLLQAVKDHLAQTPLRPGFSGHEVPLPEALRGALGKTCNFLKIFMPPSR